MNFIDKKVSVQHTIETLAYQGIHVDEEEAGVILDFLYLMSKNHMEIEKDQDTGTLTGIRTSEGAHQTENLRSFLDNLTQKSKDFEGKNRTINDRTVTVWVTGFYLHKKMRKL